jgi:uncharacterized protein YbjT (DUF2867 family)
MGARTRGTTLVLGGTGKTGRRVVERLRARGLPVRVGSRSAAPPFDWEVRATWGPAVEGADAAYIAYVPDLAVPGAPEAVGAFAELAVARGVERLVLLSGRGEEEARRAEEAVRDAGAQWTIVRASCFAQNFSESFLLDGVLAGEVALPVDDVREPFVDVEDVADVAAAALAEDGHAGRLYEVTGPRLLTFPEAVEEIALATGRPVRFATVPLDAFVAGILEAGLPDDVASLMRYLFAEIFDGRNERRAGGVREALGREPRDFAEYARAAAAAGAWAPEAA